MKAFIDINGKLNINTENETESFALTEWIKQSLTKNEHIRKGSMLVLIAGIENIKKEHKSSGA